jgi:enoyl-CoA hydratase/carnithine racemase
LPGPDPDSDPVKYDLGGGVATITLDRPERRNALTVDAMKSMIEALERSATDDSIRVVVLTGTGSTFCAGADMSGATGEPSAFAESGPRALVRLLEILLDHPKPTIARIQGNVFGGGNGLVAACDLAVAVDGAQFAFSEVRVGVAPAVVSVVCLRVMELRAATELMLTGERFGAERARATGLVTATVAESELDRAVASWVEQLSLGGPQGLRETKLLLRRLPGMPRDEAFALAGDVSSRLFAGPEAVEGMAAFKERRRPDW